MSDLPSSPAIRPSEQASRPQVVQLVSNGVHEKGP
jgi:hypothetical protein